jgi:sulfate transport system permease protein
VLPNLIPAMLSGGGLAFTRAIAEYGATNLFTGNIPLKTQVAAVNIYTRIENDQQAAAAAISVALLAIAFLVLLALDAVQRWGVRRG